MRVSLILPCIAAWLVSGSAHAQDALNNIVRGSTTTKPVFAVYDVRPAGANLAAIQDAVTAAFRVHYDGIKISQGMAPYPLPVIAPRMRFSQQSTWAGTIPVPDCTGASSVITSTDSSMAKYGEFSVLQSCIFPYQAGVRVNVFAIFGQKSGGPNINVLGAMLGRVVTNAIGLGDSSSFIDKTIDDIEVRLQSIATSVALTELQPTREGKVLAADPAQGGTQSASAQPVSESPMTRTPTANTPTSVQGYAPTGSSEQLAKLQSTIAQAAQIQREALANAQAASGQANQGGMLAARKELAAMGLTYHSQDQFVEAVRRNDVLACDLFLRAGSVSLIGSDRQGATPMQTASTREMTDLLKRYQGL